MEFYSLGYKRDGGVSVLSLFCEQVDATHTAVANENAGSPHTWSLGIRQR